MAIEARVGEVGEGVRDRQRQGFLLKIPSAISITIDLSRGYCAYALTASVG
jgi:hypothetical protein